MVVLVEETVGENRRWISELAGHFSVQKDMGSVLEVMVTNLEAFQSLRSVIINLLMKTLVCLNLIMNQKSSTFVVTLLDMNLVDLVLVCSFRIPI